MNKLILIILNDDYHLLMESKASACKMTGVKPMLPTVTNSPYVLWKEIFYQKEKKIKYLPNFKHRGEYNKKTIKLRSGSMGDWC